MFKKLKPMYSMQCQLCFCKDFFLNPSYLITQSIIFSFCLGEAVLQRRLKYAKSAIWGSPTVTDLLLHS